MIERFYRRFDDIKAPETAVENAVNAAATADPSAQIIELKPKKRRKLWISATAAVLVIAVILGVILIPHRDSTGSRFTITANAAGLGNKFGSNVIGAFMGEGPVSMGDLDEEKKDEYYIAFIVDSLHIEGEEISSVSMSTNIKEVLFMIDPSPQLKDGVTTMDMMTDDDDYEKKFDVEEGEFEYAKGKEWSKYTNLSMIDSDKTDAELRKEYPMVCNSFTYQNIDGYNPIKFEGSMMMWIKLTKTDSEIAKMLEEIDAIQDESARLHRYVAENYTDKEWKELEKKDQELNQKANHLTEQILRHIFKDGVFTVEVTFSDGTTERKTLKLGTAMQNDLYGGFCWLTISEE